jgi:hypothetical protein
MRYVLLLACLAAAPAAAAAPEAVGLDLEKWWRAEHEEIQTQIEATRGKKPREDRRSYPLDEKEAVRRDALVLDQDRDPADIVARRTAALLDDLEARLPAGALAKEREQLRSLRADVARTPAEDAPARYRLYEAACRLRRRIALRNPLLDFGDILFVKKHRSLYNHMCDQYYGFTAQPGGGLFVLHGAFGDGPKGRDVLAGATVANGRLAGKALVPGAFMSPELSFDGRTVLFAYVEPIQRDQKKNIHWRPSSYRDHDGGWGDPTVCYHIFRVNLDGTDLRQLTDGGWNDFDPCFLPNGLIAFISERRGGLGRCHGRRIVPTYTLHAMDADGNGLVPLSYHETNEWHPSVLHDGRIVYTRWDYVDRGSSAAHHPWVVFPDGRDPRAIHGNYGTVTVDKKTALPRAQMTTDLRAIPGSRRLVGTASCHHNQSYGSLFLLDANVREEEGQIRRLTPDAPFPETKDGPSGVQTYATAWPLSEDYHLCVYQPAGPRESYGVKPGNLTYPPYRLVLLDSFGNRVLIYEDPAIGCLSPIPLRPRTTPPVVPDGLEVARRGEVPAAGKPSDATGTLACLNVYDSLLPWPEGMRIQRLRIVQMYPFVCGASGKYEAGAIPMSMARGMLGTVPVEADGSAHFEAPAGKVLYFQALDESGLAVQSMMSAAYVAPGERLVCQGCHEPRHDAPSSTKALPSALRRGPSKIEPDVPGTDPVSFPRLVQPMLDKHCAACHQKEAKAPNMARTPAADADYRRALAAWKAGPMPKGALWSSAYVGLMPYIWRPGGARSTPGRVGARASELYQMLVKGHHGLKLPPEDLHRLTVWLDCNANFFGAYHDREAQARGAAVRPKLE